MKPSLVIISPALRDANNGNWQTAWRWARALRAQWRVTLARDWPGDGDSSPQAMVALHARRSAGAIARYAERHPGRPLVVVLTGTDLYRDIRVDAQARRSLDLATALVVLQEAGLDELTPAQRDKAHVIYQSARALKPMPPLKRVFEVVQVGHLRAEKDPITAMRAAQALPEPSAVRIVQIGDALTEPLGAAGAALAGHRHYVWLGGRPHGETRQRIRRARALLVTSLMEGGANVIIEAVTSGVPVLASRIPGNVGMLGRDYDGYFPPGDVDALVSLLTRASEDEGFLARLKGQCAARAPLFAPEREAAEVNRLLHSLWHSRSTAKDPT